MLRPVPTVWFELIVLRKDLARAMDCVAQTRIVQLEARTPSAGALQAARVRLEGEQARYEAIRVRFEGYWPPVAYGPFRDDTEVADRFCTAVDQLEAWARRAEQIVEDLKSARAAIADLVVLEDLFTAVQEKVPDLGHLSKIGPRLASFVGYAPLGTDPPETPDGLPVDWATGAANDFVLAMGSAEDIRNLAAQAEGAGWRILDLPRWLPDRADDALGEIRTRLDRSRKQGRRCEDELGVLHDRFHLADVLGTIEQIQWLLGCAREVGESARLARITGWALVPELDRLETGLSGCGVFHVLAFPTPPNDTDPPVVLFNPAWARRFEALTQMIGMPGAGEADPTIVVALIAPLLFGFMFGDVGQGFVLLLAGVLLRRRFPPLAILIPGGAMSMIFGVLFGSVFGREDVIPALWLHPLDQPILLLLVSVAAGAVILLTGLTLQALQMRWQGRWQDWLAGDAGLVVCYLGLLAVFIWGTPALAIAAIGALWFVLGAVPGGGAPAAARAIGELVETVLQLLVNTVSFARAGAFALAHAGLSVAIVGLSDASGPVFYWLVLALGNAFVLALEGLVVSIQTTRLLLFEFFIRFLTGGGRKFRPLVPPGHPHNTFKEAL